MQDQCARDCTMMDRILPGIKGSCVFRGQKKTSSRSYKNCTLLSQLTAIEDYLYGKVRPGNGFLYLVVVNG